jgi:hypothetical protein
LNGLGKDYSQFRISIAIREPFPNFQVLITWLISEEMRIVDTSSNGGSYENVFYSNFNRSKGGKTSFRGWHGNSHGGDHQHDGQFHRGDEETLEEEEVVEVVVEVIEVNNQIVTKTVITAETWVHGKELLSKGTWCTKCKATIRELCIN